MEDEDDLYDDSLLYKKTFRPLNESAMSCSSRQGGRLSLSVRNSASLMSILPPRFRVSCPVVETKIANDPPLTDKTPDKKCDVCGRPESEIFGTLKDHRVDCRGRSGSAFDAVDGNQNIIKSHSFGLAQKSQDAVPQENVGSLSQQTSPQQAQLSGRSSMWPSQETETSFNRSFSRIPKPSQVLKRMRLENRSPRKKRSPQQVKPAEINPKPLDLSLLPIHIGEPLQRLSEQCDSVAAKVTVVDDLVRKLVPRKKTLRVPKRPWDLSYVEGGTTSEEDADQVDVKSCPVYKRIPGTSFAVDALCHGADSRLQAHFLTRCHQEEHVACSDLPIYCTPVTALLLRQRCKVSEDMLRILELGEPRIIDSVKVTAIDAHNEPGSAVLLFQLPVNVNILYVGGLRPNPALESQPLLWVPRFRTNFLMVDTTQCQPHTMQILRDELEAAVVDLVQAQVEKHPKALVAVISDGLIEHSLFTRLAVLLDYRVFAHGSAAATIAAIGDPTLNELLTSDRKEAEIHVLPHTDCSLSDLTYKLKRNFPHVIVVRPQKGLDLEDLEDLKPDTNWKVTVIDVPSPLGASFADLRRLVRFLRPKRLVSNMQPRHDPVQNKYFRKWLAWRGPKQRKGEKRRKGKA